MEPKIAIIVLNWNGIKDTIECLDSLQKINYQNFEVIVVDNASSDDSVTILKEYAPPIVLIVNEKNLGYAGGNNKGILYALKNGADYILLLNNDTTVDPEILRNFIIAANKYPDAGIFSAKIYYYSQPNKIWFGGGRWSARKLRFFHEGFNEVDTGNMFSEPKEIDYACGCALFFRREIVARIGVLDERLFLTYEETDWCYRARMAGFRLMFIPGAKVWHKISASFGGSSSPLYAYFFSRNRLIWASRYLPFRLRLSFFKRLVRVYFPNTCRHRSKFRLINRLFWDIRSLVKNYKIPVYRARILGIFDFLLKRYGDCHHRKSIGA